MNIGCGLLLALTHWLLGQNYVGAERCGQCHQAEYRLWQESPHARAHMSLTSEAIKDSKCSKCHTLVEDISNRFNGVQCERCHGPGKYYHLSYVMKDAALSRAVGLVDMHDPKAVAAQCKQCHTDGTPSIVPFDFKTMWARIAHGNKKK